MRKKLFFEVYYDIILEVYYDKTGALYEKIL